MSDLKDMCSIGRRSICDIRRVLQGVLEASNLMAMQFETKSDPASLNCDGCESERAL